MIYMIYIYMIYIYMIYMIYIYIYDIYMIYMIYIYTYDVKPGQNTREYAEVGVVLHKKLRPFLYEAKQISSRIMAVKLRSKGKNISFICCYAPQSGHSSETKEDFYDNLQTVYSECREAVFLGGDFNARLQYRYDSEADIMGSNIFGRGRDYLERVAPTTKKNRDLLISAEPTC